jgi:UDP-glucose-4-epimerase GalE
VTDPKLYYENNVSASLKLFDSLVRNGVDKIVFSSSCATYGIPDRLPIVETCAQRPINPYGTTKLIVERILSDYDAAYRLRSVALRYFNAAGADRDGEIGEAHDPEPHLIPLAIAASRGGKPLQIMGTDYDTPDGSAIRDYVHVEDLARAHVRAVEYLLAAGKSTALNVGTGTGVSVMDIVNAVKAVTGHQVNWHQAPRRAGDPPALFSEPAKLKTVLDLDPASFASIRDIIATAAQWDIKYNGQSV